VATSTKVNDNLLKLAVVKRALKNSFHKRES